MLYLDRVVAGERMVPRLLPRIIGWDDHTITTRLEMDEEFGGYGIGEVHSYPKCQYI